MYSSLLCIHLIKQGLSEIFIYLFFSIELGLKRAIIYFAGFLNLGSQSMEITQQIS